MEVQANVALDDSEDLTFISQLIERMRDRSSKEWKTPPTVGATNRQATERTSRGRQVNAVAPSACPICKSSQHKIDGCPKLAQMDLRTLNNQLVRNNWCLRCGQHKYQRDQPCVQTCSNCAKPHASYLCKAKPPATINNVEVAVEQPASNFRELAQ